MKNKEVSRRNFIRFGSLAGFAGLTSRELVGCTGGTMKGSRDGSGKSKEIKRLAGMNLEELRDRYEEELFDRFLPAMDKYCIDKEYGGFMCDFNISTREPISTTKRTWYQGRGIWVYSYLYNNFKKDPHYLDVAGQAVDFILKLRPDSKDFYDTNYDRQGKSISPPGDIYGDLFVAEGLAEYSIAAGKPEYLAISKELILNCLAKYDQPDYIYKVTSVPDFPQITGSRVLGHWMIVLSICTQILSHQQNPDPDFVDISNRCIDAIIERHMNPNFHLLNEVVNHDFSLPNNAFAEFSIIGHAMETLAFVMEEAIRRNDPDLFIRTKDEFRRHVEVAADKLYGGYFEVLYNADKYEWSFSKSAWCQQEVSRGLLLMIEHLGGEWEQDYFSNLDDYMQKNMRKPEFAFWTFGGDRKLEKLSLKIIEHYHTPRYLMRSILTINRIIGRSGKISDFIA